jgi:hypothetical protein
MDAEAAHGAGGVVDVAWGTTEVDEAANDGAMRRQAD